LGQDTFAVGDVAGLSVLIRNHLEDADAWAMRSVHARRLALAHSWSSVVDTLVQTLEATARA
jgi:hypothetical protein